MRIDHEIKKWLSVGVNMQGSYVYRNKAYSRFINSLVSVPLGTVYNEDGSINVTPVPGDGNTINLLLNQDKSVYRDNNQNFKLFLNPYIEIRPFKGMTIQSRLNASLGYDKKNYFQGIGPINIMHQMVLMLLVLLLVFMPRLIRTEAIIINGKTFSLIILISRKTMNLL